MDALIQHKRIAAFCAVAAFCGVAAFVSLRTDASAQEAASPYGNRPEEIDLEQAFELPAVYVDGMTAAIDGDAIAGSFTAWNHAQDVMTGLSYRIEVYGTFPGQDPADPQVLFAETQAIDLPTLQPEDREPVTFRLPLPSLPSGEYAVRAQLLLNRGRGLGWGTQKLSIVDGDKSVVTVAGSSIDLPEFGKAVGALTGPNVNPDGEFTMNLEAFNGLTKAQSLKPVIRLSRMDTARGIVSTDIRDAVTVAPKQSAIPLSMKAPKEPGVYLASVTLETADGTVMSSMGRFRFVVRGAAADFLSVRPLHMETKAGETVFVRIDHVGSADAETQGTGVMEVTINDEQGVAGAAIVADLPLSDAIGSGMAQITLDRDLGASPVLTAVIKDANDKEMARSENPITLSAEQLTQLSEQSTLALWAQWYTSFGSLVRFAIIALLFLAALAVIVIARRYVSAPSTLRHAFVFAALATMLLAQVQPVLAVGGTNGIKVTPDPITLRANADFIANPADKPAYLLYWAPILDQPIVALFVNQPIHNQTYDCRGPIPFEVRVEYAACNNAPAAGRVIARFDANGGLQTTLLGTNANWIKVFEAIYSNSPNFQPPTAFIKTATFSQPIFLTGLVAGATRTTLQVVVKHNASLDAAHGVPDDVINPNELYFQRRFAQAFNLHLICQPENPNVSIVKTATVTTVQPGATWTYRLHVTNHGPTPAQNVVVTDTIPSVLTVNGTPAGCTLNGNQLTCNLGTMAANATRDIDVSVTVPANSACPAVIPNTGVVSATQDTNPNDNQSTVNVNVNCAPGADVQISKSGPTAVNRGDQLSYSLIVKNNGPGVAQNVVVTDPVPTGLTFVSASDNRCSHQNGVVTCNIGTMQNQEQFSIGLVFQSSQQTACAPVNNVATISTTSTGDNAANNQASFQTNIICQASSMSSSVQSSSISSSVPSSSVPSSSVPSSSVPSSSVPSSSVASSSVSSVPQLGCIDVIKETFNINGQLITPVAQFTFRLDGTNPKQNFADGKVRYDNVPVGIHQVTEMPAAGWALFSVTPDAGLVNVLPGPNCVVVLFKNIQTLASSSSMSSSVPSSSVPSSSVPSSSAPASSVPSSSMPSSSVASSVQSSSIASSMSSIPGAGCIEVIKETFDINGKLINPVAQFTFRLDGNNPKQNAGDGRVRFDNVTPGMHQVTEMPAAGWLLFSVTPDAGWVTVQGGPNCAVVLFKNIQSVSVSSSSAMNSSVSSVQASSVMSSSQSSAPAVMGCVEVRKEAVNPQGQPLVPVAPFTFTLDNSRTATNDANGVARFDNVPSGSHTVTEQPQSGWEQTSVIPAGGAVTVFGGSTCTQVLFRNRQLTQQQPAFTVTKTDGKTSAAAGERLDYTITITNTSNVTAANVVVADELPSSLAFISASGGDSAAAVSGQNVQWTINSMPGGTSRTLTLSAQVRAGTAGNTQVRNIARVITPVPASGEDLTIVTGGSQRVSITIDDEPDTVEPGDDLDYEIEVCNEENSDIRDLTVLQILPEEIEDVSDADGGDDDVDGGTITWEGVDIDADDCVTFDVTVEVDEDADDGDTLETTALADGDSDDETTDVEEDGESDDDAELSVTKEASPPEVFPGGVVEYTVTIENDGDDDLTDVTLEDVMSGGGFSLIDDGDADERSGNTLKWEIDELEAGDSMVVHYRISVDASAFPGQQIRNTATVEADDMEDSAEAVVTIINNLPQTGAGFGTTGRNANLRPYAAGKSSGSAPWTAILSIVIAGLGTGTGMGVGRKLILGL